MRLTPEQGRAIVRYARDVIESQFGGDEPEVPGILRDVFSENRGVFVTLQKNPGNVLRGCIGFPEPVMPLGRAVEDSAISAAFRDPRFPPLREEELSNVTVEVSVLTQPELIKVDNPREYPKEIKIGRDGLIIRKGYFSGLLLPQVPVEWDWDAEEFLANTCQKAGLTPDMWLSRDVELYKFHAQIFSEVEAGGDIVEKDITQES